MTLIASYRAGIGGVLVSATKALLVTVHVPTFTPMLRALLATGLPLTLLSEFVATA